MKAGTFQTKGHQGKKSTAKVQWTLYCPSSGVDFFLINQEEENLMDTIEKMVRWLDEKYYYIPAFMVVYLMMR